MVVIKADTTGQYGNDGVLPAIDVRTAFENASGKKRMNFKFDPNIFSQLNPNEEERPANFHVKDHIQSVARLSGEGQENILVFTRSARTPGKAGIYVVPFNDIQSDGDAWEREFKDRKTEDFTYYEFDDVNHAGGVQALGSLVFVANDCDDGNKCNARIEILDLNDPFDLSKSREDRFINRLEINQSVSKKNPTNNGEPRNSAGELINDLGKAIDSRAAAVAATRLEDGKYLMFVGGRGSVSHGWFYISDSTDIRNTTWSFVDFWDDSDLPGGRKGSKWNEWETINFIPDRSGDIYMVAMGTVDNKSFLYRLTQTGTDLNFEYIDGRGLDTSAPNANFIGIKKLVGVTTRFGAGIHVTPDGNIVSYVTDKNPERIGLKINQFSYHDRSINGTDGDDTLIGTEKSDVINGKAGNDFIDGKESDDFIDGGFDNDTIYGGRGNDDLDGFYGNDLLGGWIGNDTMYGGSGNDSLYGDTGVDAIYGEDGNDLMFGHTNAPSVIARLGEDYSTDYLYGGRGHDTMYGNHGNDLLGGWSENDLMYGDAGDDSLYGDTGIDTLHGGDGNDLMFGHTNASSVIAQLGEDYSTDYLYGGNGNDTMYGNHGNDEVFGDTGDDTVDGGSGDDFVSGGEGNDTVYGGLGDDTLDGWHDDDEVFGFYGNDILYGGLGNDTLHGEDDDDTLYGFEGNDSLYGDTGNDILDGEGHSDYVNGGEGNDEVFGNTGNDTVDGGSENDYVDGGEGDDLVYGGLGDDTLFGEDGNDFLNGGYDVDYFSGGSGNDTVSFENSTITSGIIVDLGKEQATFSHNPGVVEKLISIENIIGTERNDTITGDDFNNQFYGRNGKDHLFGNSGNDTLFGENGDDNLYGGHGDDSLIGGSGNDYLRGDAGADTLDGGAGIDRALFNTANAGVNIDLSQGIATTTNANTGVLEEDTLISIELIRGSYFGDRFTGDASNNVFNGEDGDDTLRGGIGNDSLSGDAGADIIDGGEGIDRASYRTANARVNANLNREFAKTINADTGNLEEDTLINIEQLYGSDFNDKLTGNAEANILAGFAGDDTLTGGNGNDLLTGHGGADTFVFTNANFGVDRIGDFNTAEEDKIHISASGFGGNLTTGLLDADYLVFGTTAMNSADRFIYNQTSGSLSFDADGSGAIEAIEIATLHNRATLSHSDFVIF